ncbi:MAG TPA: helix-turn-helix domain-containing protein [Solirubrobacteraceae bacterium]|nr:helix-turn-helix domain-containing protein [Solirubrobacteraceae bacterium]
MRVDELLRASGVAGVTLVAGPWDARTVRDVTIVDELDDIDQAATGCLAILTRHASSRAAGYALDVVLRKAGDRELAAVAVYGSTTTSITAIRLADRSRVALLAIAPDRDLSELSFELEDTLRSGADAMLRRILTVLEIIGDASQAPTEGVLAKAQQALGATVRLAPMPDDAVSVPVMIDGAPDGYVCADTDDAAVRVGCQLIADSVARAQISLRASRRAAALARAEAIADVLRTPIAGVDGAAKRARLLDLPVDGRHVVVALETVASSDAGDRDALLRRATAQLDELERGWHPLLLDETIVLVRMTASQASARAASEVAHALLARLAGGRGSRPLVCGVSSERVGVDGLRAAADEAREALHAARSEERVNEPFSFDRSPLRQLLVELVSSNAARGFVDGLLAPLDELGPARAPTAIRTLHVYLDERGSLKAASRRLHLHPNAVAYRIKQIRTRLEADLDDPDLRLAVQMACRARLLADGQRPVTR